MNKLVLFLFTLTILIWTFIIPGMCRAQEVQVNNISINLPLVSEEVSIDTPTTMMFPQDIIFWNTLSMEIRKTPTKKVSLRVQGVGGEAFVLNNIIRSIQDAQTNGIEVNMDVIGPSQSAMAMLVCVGNKIIIRDGGSLMFHSMSHPVSLFFNLISYDGLTNGNNDPSYRTLQNYLLQLCVNKGLLDQNTLKAVNEGMDVTITKENGKINIYISDDERVTKSQVFISILILFTLLLFALELIVITARSIMRKR